MLKALTFAIDHYYYYDYLLNIFPPVQSGVFNLKQDLNQYHSLAQ